jgi:hypothetical protein
VIGTICRECPDHVIVFSEPGLYRRHLRNFVDYYHEARTHLALEKDTPEHRAVQVPALGRVVAIPKVGGLHHRNEHRAASEAFAAATPSNVGRVRAMVWKFGANICGCRDRGARQARSVARIDFPSMTEA